MSTTVIQVHYAGRSDAVTACGKITARVKASGNRREVNCPTCATKIGR